jgi:hypothetical protein
MVTTPMIKPLASKADSSRASLPLSTRLGALASGCLAIFTLILFGGSVCRAQGTYTAASCSQSDVNAVINGPTHKAVNGDTIIIPATGSPCTWTSGITISGVGIDITGTGTPNTGAGTVGAGTSDVTIIEAGAGSDNYNQSPANGTAIFSFQNLPYSSTAKVELLTVSAAGAAANSLLGPFQFTGICTTTPPYCPSIRVDNITFAPGTWTSPTEGGLVITDDVFGVIDHNTTTENATGSAGVTILQDSYASWQGVGSYGDNSFASPDTFGTAQTIFVENNSLTGTRGSENDVAPFGGPGIGGARYAVRFNNFPSMSGVGICSNHGTAWSGRGRGQRQVECYYNIASSSSSCDDISGMLGGTGYFLSNTFTGVGCNEVLQLDIARFIKNVAPWNNCDGTQPWDFAPWSSTTPCLDQPGSGGGSLYTAQDHPTLASAPGTACATAGQCWPNPALDPVYEAGNTTPNGAVGIVVISDGSSTRLLANRDYYAHVSNNAQTSPTSPFNGTVGTGYGALANRPPCTSGCRIGVGYWATDQGTWNTYNGQKGILYTLIAPGTWAAYYTPYTYPHPLTAGGSTTGGGGPTPPSGLTAAVD